jgi:membrane fusion protein (multidrug efflux system)
MAQSSPRPDERPVHGAPPASAPLEEPTSSPGGDAETAAEPGSAVDAGTPEKRSASRRRKRRSPFVVLAGLALVVLAVIGGYLVLTAGQESTDDAQVEADIVPIGARVGGQVLRVHIKDNQKVKKGQLLVELDDADFRAKVQQAEAQVETAEAQAVAADNQAKVAEASAKGGLTTAKAMVSGSSEQVQSAQAQVEAGEAALKRAKAQAHRTALDLARVRELLKSNAVPQQQLDNAQAADDSAQAAVALAQAQLTAAKQGKQVALSQVAQAQGRLDQSKPIDSQIAVAEANAKLAHARVKSTKAALGLVKLQLSYTHITAPADGLVSKLSVHQGQLVQPGQPVAEFVPNETYIVADFKETQLARIRAGQKAEIKLDAYPGKKFSARVESLSGATGARFALLPPDNASGNFVKVVQRVPVRLSWDRAPDEPMRAGLSADVTVFTK